MRIALLTTGGKDSTLVLSNFLKRSYNVEYLVTIFPSSEDSWMFHYPTIRLVPFFAEAVGIPLVSAESSSEKKREPEELARLIEPLDVDTIASGVVTSDYQRTRIEQICDQLGRKCLTPLWQKKPLDILKEVLALQFDVLITGVSSYGLNREWLGKKIDIDTVEALIELNKQYGVSLIGEGGEYETLVCDAPFFNKKIKIISAEKVWKKQSGYLSVTSVALEDKLPKKN